MEQHDKMSELLSLMQEYRSIKEEELMFHIRMSMEEVQSTSQKVVLSEKIRVLLSELPLTYKERHRLLDYTISFLPFWFRVLCHSLDLTIMIGGLLLVSHTEAKMKREDKNELLLIITYELLNSACNRYESVCHEHSCASKILYSACDRYRLLHVMNIALWVKCCILCVTKHNSVCKILL